MPSTAAKPIVVSITPGEDLYSIISEIQSLNPSAAKEGATPKKAPGRSVVKGILTAVLTKASSDTISVLASESTSSDKKDKVSAYVASIIDARNKELSGAVPKTEADQLALIDLMLKQNPALKSKIKG